MNPTLSVYIHTYICVSICNAIESHEALQLWRLNCFTWSIIHRYRCPHVLHKVILRSGGNPLLNLNPLASRPDRSIAEKIVVYPLNMRSHSRSGSFKEEKILFSIPKIERDIWRFPSDLLWLKCSFNKITFF